MKVGMRNPKTGEIKQVKVGWSWTLFFFSGMFGIPLFLRGLHMWGAVFLAVGSINLIMPTPTEEVQAIASCSMWRYIWGFRYLCRSKATN